MLIGRDKLSHCSKMKCSRIAQPTLRQFDDLSRNNFVHTRGAITESKRLTSSDERLLHYLDCCWIECLTAQIWSYRHTRSRRCALLRDERVGYLNNPILFVIFVTDGVESVQCRQFSSASRVLVVPQRTTVAEAVGGHKRRWFK
jgi:hypothetical protein